MLPLYYYYVSLKKNVNIKKKQNSDFFEGLAEIDPVIFNIRSLQRHYTKTRKVIINEEEQNDLQW